MQSTSHIVKMMHLKYKFLFVNILGSPRVGTAATNVTERPAIHNSVNGQDGNIDQ